MNQQTFLRATRFLLVGGSAFVLDASILFGLTHYGLGEYPSRAVSMSVCIVYSFFVHRRTTFATPGFPTLTEFAGYLAASLLGIIINYGVFALAVHFGVSPLLATAAGTGVASIVNFLNYGRIFKS